MRASKLLVASPEAAPGLGMSLCPGKKDPDAMTGPCERDLREDLTVIREWGAGTIITLLEDWELAYLGVKNLGRAAIEFGMSWRRWPVIDGSALRIKNCESYRLWNSECDELLDILNKGGKIFIHCRGGLGRAGTLAARLLIQKGLSPEEAIEQVRAARPGAIESWEQEEYLLERQWTFPY